MPSAAGQQSFLGSIDSRQRPTDCPVNAILDIHEKYRRFQSIEKRWTHVAPVAVPGSVRASKQSSESVGSSSITLQKGYLADGCFKHIPMLIIMIVDCKAPSERATCLAAHLSQRRACDAKRSAKRHTWPDKCLEGQ